MSEFGLDVAARSRPETARAEAYAALYNALDETSGSSVAAVNTGPIAPLSNNASISTAEGMDIDRAPAETEITFGTRDQSEPAVIERSRTIPQGGQAVARSIRAQLKAEPPVPAEPAPDSLQTFLAMARAAVRRKAGEDGTAETGPASAPPASPNGARERLARLKARLSESTSATAAASTAPVSSASVAAAPITPARVASEPANAIVTPATVVTEVAADVSPVARPASDDAATEVDSNVEALPVAAAQIAPLADDVMFIEDASVPLVVDQAPLPLTSSASIATVTSPPVAPLRSSEQSAKAGYVPPAPISQPEQAPRASLGPTWSGTAVLKAVPAERIVTFSFADLPDIQRERARATVQRSMPSQSTAVIANPMPRWFAISMAALGGLCVFGIVFGLHFALR